MKKLFGLLIAAGLLMGITTASFAQQTLSDEEYSYVTMDLQGILNLTMTTNPQVDFVFKTIQEYQNGITKWNAVQLQVDATVAWDLFAYASTDLWTPVEPYSANGIATVPAEILQIQAVNGQGVATGWNMEADPYNFSDFTPINGKENAMLDANNLPAGANQTQHIAGMFGPADGQQMAPGTAAANPATHQFRLHYRLEPGIPAKFNTALTSARLGAEASDYLTSKGPADVLLLADPAEPQSFVQAGYYYLEVVYTLIESL